MKRGKIVQYDGAKGAGIVVVNGQQLSFAISQWQGEEAPVLNRLVELVERDGSVSTISPVSEATVLKEQTQAVQKKVQERGKVIYSQVIETYGLPVTIAYLLFVVAIYMLTYVSVQVFMASGSFTLSRLVTHLGATGESSLLGPIFWLALLAPVVPYFLKNRLAWLGLVVPALLIIFVGLYLWGEYQSQAESMRSITSALSEMGSGYSKKFSFSSIFSFGAGFYLALITSAYLARVGIARYLTR